MVIHLIFEYYSLLTSEPSYFIISHKSGCHSLRIVPKQLGWLLLFLILQLWWIIVSSPIIVWLLKCWSRRRSKLLWLIEQTVASGCREKTPTQISEIFQRWVVQSIVRSRPRRAIHLWTWSYTAIWLMVIVWVGHNVGWKLIRAWPTTSIVHFFIRIIL